MSKYPSFLRWTLPAATVFGMALTMTAQTPVLGGEAARLDGFTQADGSNVFALTIKPSIAAATGPRDVVILVSTAASQTGDYRAKSLATLQATLSNLGPSDRVKLVAFDLNAVPLTQGFVAPNSPEMAAALERLNQRTPLGSCDLEKALETAAKSFSDSKSARAIVYIGDGSSRANVSRPINSTASSTTWLPSALRSSHLVSVPRFRNNCSASWPRGRAASSPLI